MHKSLSTQKQDEKEGKEILKTQKPHTENRIKACFVPNNLHQVSGMPGIQV